MNGPKIAGDERDRRRLRWWSAGKWEAFIIAFVVCLFLVGKFGTWLLNAVKGFFNN